MSKKLYSLLRVLSHLLGELISFKIMVSNQPGNETINFNAVSAHTH